jgi:hypothetical protein
VSLKARTPIIDYDDSYAIELGGSHPAQERDRLTDQAMVIAYDRVAQAPMQWRLRALLFDRGQWTRSGIRRWWAAHEVRFLAADKPDTLVPEVCRAYGAPHPTLPTILLCHRNTPMLPAHQQIAALSTESHRTSSGGPHKT